MSTPADSNPQPDRDRLVQIGDTVFLLDGPGDTTVRPCPPELLPIMLKERDKYVQAGLLPPWTGPWPENQPPAPPEKKEDEPR
jgi:hypothetical protein